MSLHSHGGNGTDAFFLSVWEPMDAVHVCVHAGCFGRLLAVSSLRMWFALPIAHVICDDLPETWENCVFESCRDVDSTLHRLKIQDCSIGSLSAGEIRIECRTMSSNLMS